MLLMTLREPPPKGSLQESLLILLVLKKEHIEHARLRTLAQAIINKEKGPEVFEEYRKTAFPWVETQKKRDQQDHVRILAEEVKRGALGIRALWGDESKTKVRSRLKTRVVETEDVGHKRTPEELRQLYSKLGSVVPK